jgi:hypothetical protein
MAMGNSKTILVLLFTFFGLTGAFSQENEGRRPVDTTSMEYIRPVKNFNKFCLTAPEGFETTDEFNGFVHWNTKSSILVSEVHGRTIVDAEESLNDEYYKSNQVTLVSKTKIKTDFGEDALLYKFSFDLNKDKWFRYSLFIGSLNSVLWINASYLEKYEKVVETEIVNSLKTTKFKVK